MRHINQPDVNSTALSNSSNQIDIGIDLSDFLLNVEWDVMAVPATRRERTYECCVGAFQGKSVGQPNSRIQLQIVVVVVMMIFSLA